MYLKQLKDYCTSSGSGSDDGGSSSRNGSNSGNPAQSPNRQFEINVSAEIDRREDKTVCVFSAKHKCGNVAPYTQVIYTIH